MTDKKEWKNPEEFKEYLDNLPTISEKEFVDMLNDPETEISTRYSAVGKPLPDRTTMCLGQCDGMGFYPHKIDHLDKSTEEEKRRWQKCHEESRDCKKGKCDGYHFITCPDCEGTGLRLVTEVVQ